MIETLRHSHVCIHGSNGDIVTRRQYTHNFFNLERSVHGQIDIHLDRLAYMSAHSIFIVTNLFFRRIAPARLFKLLCVVLPSPASTLALDRPLEPVD